MANPRKKQKPGKVVGTGGVSSKVWRPEEVTFHYLKGPDFRTIHIDGAIGGITPSGFLHIAFFCERMAIPKTVKQKIKDDGTLGDEIDRDVREGVVRQMEIDVVMGEEAVKNLKVWLDRKLEGFEARRRITKSQDKSK